MVRLCFSRKHKTLRSVFTNKNVLDMLEKNYKTFCALKNKPVDPRPVKDRIIALLEEAKLHDKRAAKMDQDDFLRLLELFNAHDFHFTTAAFSSVLAVTPATGPSDEQKSSKKKKRKSRKGQQAAASAPGAAVAAAVPAESTFSLLSGPAPSAPAAPAAPVSMQDEVEEEEEEEDEVAQLNRSAIMALGSEDGFAGMDEEEDAEDGDDE